MSDEVKDSVGDAAVRRRALQAFIATDRSHAGLERSRLLVAERVLQIRQHPAISIDAPYRLWSPDAERSFGRMAHGFIAAPDWLGAIERLSQTDAEKLAARVIELVSSWRAAATADAGMAFHDETTAQRVINLVAFRDCYRHLLSDEDDAILRAVVARDVALLMSEGFHAGLNNHGMFQDVALMVAADLFEPLNEPAAVRNLALSRLHRYFSVCFSADGVHVENTPTYHVMVSRYLSRVLDYAGASGHGSEYADLANVLDRAEEYAAHAVTPAGAFPPVSDTATLPLDTDSYRSAFPGRAFAGAVSRGQRGEPPTATAYTTEISGYAIHRSAWCEPSASFVFFSAAYNADYHKHADELSVYVMHNGRELLRESGPYGYDRRDPFTQFAFSSAAHNTLLVDGQGLPRTDGKRDATTLTDVASTTRSLDVRGETRRFDGVVWRRSVQVSESGASDPIIVSDEMTSQDEHRYTLLWHFGLDLKALVRGNAVELFDFQGQKVAELTWDGAPSSSVRLVRGQRTPYIQGWAFPTMGKAVPATALEVEFQGNAVEIRWELRTRNFKIIDRGLNPSGSEWSSFAGEKPLNYLLERPTEVADRLVVVFTAVHQPWDFTYNYRASLADSRAARLYILDDFGDQGAYYLANGRDAAIFRSVQALIRSVMGELGIGADRVVTLGSSKGGASAIMHGVALGVERVLSAAPQTRIGSFVAGPHPNILRYISGGETAQDVAWLNRSMWRALASGVRSTKIEVIVGQSDHHYRDHVLPFVEDARSLGYVVRLLAVPGTPHAEIGAAFRGFLSSWLKAEELQDGIPHVVGFDSRRNEAGVAVMAPEGHQVAFRLMHGRDVRHAVGYQSAANATARVSSPGRYRWRIFLKDASGHVTAFGSDPVGVRA